MADAAPVWENVWLIERGQSLGQEPPVWWAEDESNRAWGGEWTTDPWKATRYLSRDDAAEAMGRFYFGSPGAVGASLVEHGFEVPK